MNESNRPADEDRAGGRNTLTRRASGDLCTPGHERAGLRVANLGPHDGGWAILGFGGTIVARWFVSRDAAEHRRAELTQTDGLVARSDTDALDAPTRALER